MILNFLLLLAIIVAIILLFKQIRKPSIDHFLIPTCEFTITKPKFEINQNVRIAKYSVLSKYKDRYFQDFPVGFKFYSDHNFSSNIRISYTVSDSNEVEVIYDKLVEFNNNAKEYIYYINDVIIGKINIEVYTLSINGKPSIEFEILQGSICHVEKEYKLQIVFPS